MDQQEQDAVHRAMMFDGVSQVVMLQIARPYIERAIELLREGAVIVDAPLPALGEAGGLAAYGEQLRLAASDANVQAAGIPEGDGDAEAAFRATSLLQAFADLFSAIGKPLPKADEHEAAYPAVMAWYAARQVIWARPWLQPDERAELAVFAAGQLIDELADGGDAQELEGLAQALLHDEARFDGPPDELEDLVAELRRRARAMREAARSSAD